VHPCCPDHAGGRGAPYTPHWFIFHDSEGRIDLDLTWREGLPVSDQALANSLFVMFESSGTPLRYGKQSKRWYLWNGSGRYAPRLETFLDNVIEDVARWLRDAVQNAWDAVTGSPAWAQHPLRKRIEDHWKPCKALAARMWNDAGQRAAGNVLMRTFGTDDSLFDRETGRITVDNGVIDYAQVARDGYVVLQPHDSTALITRRCGDGVAWEPDAVCPHFTRFIRESVPDAAQRYWLLWRVAHTLFGNQPRKGFVNMIGETNTGKTTFTDIIALLAGDYAKSVQVETFTSKARGDSGFRQHELMGARFVHTHEPDARDTYDVSFMKQVTGNDMQTTRTLFQGFIRWKPQCTPFIGSNSPIRFNTADNAMVQRQEAVLFARGYQRMDERLPVRMAAELNGILRLLMSVVTWEPDGLPASMVDLRERMAVATEDALEFVTEWIAEGRLHDDPAAPSYRCVQVGPLYQQYRVWCEDAGVRAVGRKTFSAIVGRKYARQRSGGVWQFTGLVTSLVTLVTLAGRQAEPDGHQSHQNSDLTG
jgi:P4 family phage/plasmid primase-like protien